jgi:hypothetical protein
MRQLPEPHVERSCKRVFLMKLELAISSPQKFLFLNEWTE